MKNKLLDGISKKNLDGFLVTSIHDIQYLTNYSNSAMSKGEIYLLITKINQYIFASGLYGEAIKKQVLDFEFIELGVVPFKESLQKLVEKNDLKKIGIDENNLTVSEFKFFKKVFPKLSHFTTSEVRSIKTSAEIKEIEKACKVADLAFNHILKYLKVGVSEKQIAFEIEMFIKKQGADVSFPTIAAFGKNSSIPHHQTGDSKLKNPSIILMDFGARVNNYCSDMTRTIFFGAIDKQQKKIYEAVYQSQQKALQLIKKMIKNNKSIKASSIDKEARDYIKSVGFESIPHSLGHGVGHEIHESPWLSIKSKDILKPGMVFSIEPGIYIPNFGGVRIEDLYVLEEKNIRQITKSPSHYPHQLDPLYPYQ